MKTLNDAMRLQMIDRISKKIQADFELEHPPSFSEDKLADNKWHELAEVDVQPIALGPFAPAISEMRVEITGAIDDETGIGFLNYQYFYEHPDGGSNGKKVGFVLDAIERVRVVK